jgi:hypothetical protein
LLLPANILLLYAFGGLVRLRSPARTTRVCCSSTMVTCLSAAEDLLLLPWTAVPPVFLAAVTSFDERMKFESLFFLICFSSDKLLSSSPAPADESGDVL